MIWKICKADAQKCHSLAVIAGVKKRVSCHLARHTFATTVIPNKGVDIVSVSKMLGHKNLRTTQAHHNAAIYLSSTGIHYTWEGIVPMYGL